MVALVCCPLVGAESSSKYSDPVANDRATNPSFNTGHLYIDVLCGHNLFSKDVVVQRVDAVGTVAN